MAQVLQFTLPGSPCIYYGVELGMNGGNDPEQRGPMQWNLVTDNNAQLEWMRHLIDVRRNNRALRVGDFDLLETNSALAFMRRTDRVGETTVVVANPSSEEIDEVIMLLDSKIMSYGIMRDEISGEEFRTMAGMLPITVPPRTIYALRPVVEETIEYSPYSRVQR